MSNACVGRAGRLPTRLGGLLLLAGAAAACGDLTAPEVQRPATVVVSPAEVEVTSIGASVVFTARVFDAHGRELKDVPLSWEVADSAILAASGNGAFRAIGLGRTSVRATVSATRPAVDPESYLSGQGAVGLGSVLVDQRPARLEINPGQQKLWAVGARSRLTARIVDALGTPMLTEPTIAWGAEDEAVASVDQTGQVRAMADGATRIVALIEGVPAAAATIQVSSVIRYRACVEQAPRDGHTKQLCAGVRLTARARENQEQ